MADREWLFSFSTLISKRFSAVKCSEKIKPLSFNGKKMITFLIYNKTTNDDIIPTFELMLNIII